MVSLMTPTGAWSFDNGSEFPGATGGLTVEPRTGRDGKDRLKLVGNFTKGGNYVQAGRAIDKVDIRELSMWVRTPDVDRFTIRLNDASGQTHQIDIKTEARADWQRVVFPLEQFFARRGQSDAVTVVAKYESWGGAKDGQWHGPATAIYFLLGHPGDKGIHTLELGEIAVLPRPAEVAGAEVKSVIRLDDIAEGEHDWRFSRGEEFAGAQGSLTAVPDRSTPRQASLKLAGDFRRGGVYVAAIKDLKDLGAKDVAAIRMRVKSENAKAIGVQMVDGTGQTHQQAWVPIVADGRWHELVLEPRRVAGGEHWGGANDGKWHAPPSQLAISVSVKADEARKQPVVFLADIRAEVLLPVFAHPAAFQGDFEESPTLPSRWIAEGGASISSTSAFHGLRSLLLKRSLAGIEQACSATSPAFDVAPGQWEIGLVCKSDLHSPDSSYNGLVDLECSDRAGKVVERITIAELFGKRDWQSVRKRVELPRNATSARFHARLNKTYGSFWVDDLSAVYLAPATRKDDRIARLLFSTSRLGNLALPRRPAPGGDHGRDHEAAARRSAHDLLRVARLLGRRADAARDVHAQTRGEEGGSLSLRGNDRPVRRRRWRSAAITRCMRRSLAKAANRSATSPRSPSCRRPRPGASSPRRSRSPAATGTTGSRSTSD